MEVLVSDTSVIIDLDRGNLLEDIFRLNHRYCVPDLLFENELSGELGDHLLGLGLEIVELDADEAGQAQMLRQDQRKLSVPDAFAFTLATSRDWTLLTGDGELRALATRQRHPMHGVLWVIEQLYISETVNADTLHECLTTIHAHPRCRLPTAEVNRLLKRFAGG